MWVKFENALALLALTLFLVRPYYPKASFISCAIPLSTSRFRILHSIPHIVPERPNLGSTSIAYRLNRTIHAWTSYHRNSQYVPYLLTRATRGRAICERDHVDTGAWITGRAGPGVNRSLRTPHLPLFELQPWTFSRLFRAVGARERKTLPLYTCAEVRRGYVRGCHQGTGY